MLLMKRLRIASLSIPSILTALGLAKKLGLVYELFKVISL